jgi:CDP-diacylglycerol--glycerol-3-phosphate 3-phosphatidyltransferase
MLSVYKIKPRFQQLLTPLLVRLHRAGITANQITWSAMILSLAVGIGFWMGDKARVLFLCLPVGLLIRMALNALDGMMARTYQQQTRTGEVLNELGDVASDLCIYFPLLKYERDNGLLIALFLCLSVVNEFSGLLGKVVSGQRRYDGPMGKSDRALFMGIYGLLCFFSIEPGFYSLPVFSVVILLLMVSTLTRTLKSLA